jgi:hypothetical protein
MPVSVPNPYKGDGTGTEETCSVSFAAQQRLVGGVDGAQTEAQFNKSKLLGEWGVLKAKVKAGEIPAGTKVATAVSKNGTRVELKATALPGKLGSSIYTSTGKKVSSEIVDIDDQPDAYAKLPSWAFIIVKAVNGPPSVTVNSQDAFLDKVEKLFKMESGGKLTNDDLDVFNLYAQKGHLVEGVVVAETTAHKLVFKGDHWELQKYSSFSGTYQHFAAYESIAMGSEFDEENGDFKWTLPYPTGKTAKPTVAAPTTSTAVPATSTSAGSMTDEDIATMFVQIKDKLAAEKNVNIKGANPALDAEVFKAIGDQTGYTPAEASAKVNSYKATGKKLSSLKKKVVKKGAPATTTVKPETDKESVKVPHEAATATVNKATEAVAEVVDEEPGTMYSDEDIAALYIMIKDKVVAESEGKWTLYSKNDDLDSAIYGGINDQTGLKLNVQKAKIAAYLAGGKKLSQLKKSLIKQGKMKAEADTLKGGEKKNASNVDKGTIDDHAKAGTTPPPVSTKTTDPSTASTNPPTKKAVELTEQRGDIGQYSVGQQEAIYAAFKTYSSAGGTYLSDTPQAILTNSFDKAEGFQKTYPGITPLQVLRIVDAQGAIKFKAENGHLFEKKVVEYLTTPGGKSWHKKYEQEKIAKAEAAIQAAKDKAEKDKAEAEALKVAKELEANQPALPEDSSLFRVVRNEEAYGIGEDMLRTEPWTDSQRKALKTYTGSSYTAMNGALRQGGGSDNTKRLNKNAQAGMRPSTDNYVFHRGMGLDGLGISNPAAIWGLTGKTIQDKGFMSTSTGGQAAFGGTVKLVIQAPKGTPMAFVANISNFRGENEVLLAAGTKYKVLRIEKTAGTWGGSSYVVHVRVVT